MKKTAYLYILKEILPVFFIGLMTFTVLLLMDKILKLIEMIVNRGVDLSRVLMLLLFISPSFLIFTIPMAVLLSVLLSFGRLSGDSEVTAFKASGISLYQLFLPVFVFSLCACLLTTFLVHLRTSLGKPRFHGHPVHHCSIQSGYRDKGTGLQRFFQRTGGLCGRSSDAGQRDETDHDPRRKGTGKDKYHLCGGRFSGQQPRVAGGDPETFQRRSSPL